MSDAEESKFENMELPTEIELPNGNLIIMMFLIGLMLLNVYAVSIIAEGSLSTADAQSLTFIAQLLLLLFSILLIVFVYNHVQFWRNYLSTPTEVDWE